MLRWKKIIREATTLEETTPNKFNISIIIDDKLLDLNKVNNKEIYNSIINKYIIPPTALNQWITDYPLLENLDWSQISTLTSNITTETYYCSFQYKVLNPIILKLQLQSQKMGNTR